MSNYWNEAYDNLELPQVPSQFAAFVANEVNNHHVMIDLGCGNGRDTFFFASLGFKTIGVDASTSAIRFCNNKTTNLSLSKELLFVNADITKYLTSLDIDDSQPICFYSRFVYHSLDEATSNEFLKKMAHCLQRFKSVAFLEFRSPEDAAGTKLTPEHFRRFESLEVFSHKCHQVGLEVTYAIAGRGFAKWGTDDAVVVRVAFKSL